MGRPREAETLAIEAVEQLERSGDVESRAAGLACLAAAQATAGDKAKALASLEASLALAEQLDAPRQVARCLHRPCMVGPRRASTVLVRLEALAAGLRAPLPSSWAANAALVSWAMSGDASVSEGSSRLATARSAAEAGSGHAEPEDGPAFALWIAARRFRELGAEPEAQACAEAAREAVGGWVWPPRMDVEGFLAGEGGSPAAPLAG